MNGWGQRRRIRSRAADLVFVVILFGSMAGFIGLAVWLLNALFGGWGQ